MSMYSETTTSPTFQSVVPIRRFRFATISAACSRAGADRISTGVSPSSGLTISVWAASPSTPDSLTE